VLFDAVIVTRASAEGRIMKKWLDAARRKMGGLHLFPKDGAKYVFQILTEFNTILVQLLVNCTQHW
jgi:hypothetical protein